MLPPTDLPYKFFPAKPSAVFRHLVLFFNRKIALPGKNHRVKKIQFFNSENVAAGIADRNARLLLIPNHPTHSDPQVISESARRLGMAPAFMAAYDVFLLSRAHQFVMQRMGSFSVNRDASDRAALAEAQRILTAPRTTTAEGELVIFPEGNVFLSNDSVVPMLDGAALIGLRAQKKLIGTSDARVLALPIAIKYTALTDPTPAIDNLLDKLARDLVIELPAGRTRVEKIRHVGLVGLRKFLYDHQHADLANEINTTDIQGTLQKIAEILTERIEAAMGLSAKVPGELALRARKIRRELHRQLTVEDRDAAHPDLQKWAAETMLLRRILSYSGDYLAQPTRDRALETVVKIHEDLHSCLLPPTVPRLAMISFAPAIDLRERLTDGAKPAVDELTREFEAAVQAELDSLAEKNTQLGGEILTD